MMTGNMQNLTNLFFTYIYLKKEISNKEKADIIILSSLLIAYFLGCVISSILLNIGSNSAIDNARYATLGLLVVVAIKLFASKTYVALECDRSSCLCDFCPTSQFIFENSAQLHHYCVDHLNTGPIKPVDSISRDIENSTASNVEMTRQDDIVVRLPPQELSKT